MFLNLDRKIIKLQEENWMKEKLQVPHNYSVHGGNGTGMP